MFLESSLFPTTSRSSLTPDAGFYPGAHITEESEPVNHEDA